MRFAAFLAVLAAAFGIAVAAGSAFGPEPTSDDAAAHGDAMEMEGHGEEGGSDAPHGLAVADHGLRLVVETPELRKGQSGTLRFRVVDEDDQPVRDFEPEQTKRMHTIVVRRDLTGFQHVHPEMAADGTWSVPLRIDDPGSYRMYADFVHEGEKQTLASDLRVDGDADLRPLPAPSTTSVSDGGDTVTIDVRGDLRAGAETRLLLAVTRDGKPVAIDPYLGAGGHLVALREGDLAYLHVHPVESEMAEGRSAFMATFPSAGRYRLFLQYRVGAQVRTVAFTLEVTP